MLPKVTNREELIAIVQRVLDMGYTEEQMPQILDLLVRSTGCPEVSNLIFWPKRDTTAAEIVDAARSHRPIILRDAHGTA
jgi:hypothetical protein